MPISRSREGYLVSVSRRDALPGYKRIRLQVNGDYERAEDVLAEINSSIDVYGKYPHTLKDRPLEKNISQVDKRSTLRTAAEIALATHWKNTSYERTVKIKLPPIIRFFEKIGKGEMDLITSKDIDAFIEDCWDRGNKNITVNKNLSMLSVVNKVAMERTPPLAKKKLPIKKLKEKAPERWWLPPDKLDEVLKWLNGPKGEPVFADYILMIVMEGLRVTEALDLEPRHFSGLSSSKPMLKVPGTKTKGSEATIAVFKDTVPLVARCIKRAEENGWEKLFPYTWRTVRDNWNEVREFLGVEHIETSTLRSLRRTFAHYANTRGMTTDTLMKHLRHSTIITTTGYLDLVGADSTELARRSMDDEVEEPKASARSPIGDLVDVIKAYKEAVPEASATELAEFIKEMRA